MPGWKPITFPDVVFTECIRTANSGSCHVKVRVHTLPSSTYHTHKCSTCLTTWAGVFVVEWNCSPAPRLTTIKLNHGSREVRPTILSHKTWPFSLRATTPNTLHILTAFFFFPPLRKGRSHFPYFILYASRKRPPLAVSSPRLPIPTSSQFPCRWREKSWNDVGVVYLKGTFSKHS